MSSSSSIRRSPSAVCSSRTCLRVRLITPRHTRVHAYEPTVSLPTDVGESDQPIPLPNVSSSVLKKVRSLAQDASATPAMLIILYRFRFSSIASTIVESHCRRQTQQIPTMRASALPTSASGIRSSLPWTRKCYSRLSSRRTTLISSLSCTSYGGACWYVMSSLVVQ